MTRPLCEIHAPWDVGVFVCTANMAHVLRDELGLHYLAERLEKAQRPAELRPVLKDIRAHAETASAVLYRAMADARAHRAEEVQELCGILLQRTQRRAG